MLTAKLQEAQHEYDLFAKSHDSRKEDYDQMERELRRL